MPRSEAHGKTEIQAWVRQLRKAKGRSLTAIDIGPGEGIFAKLLRQYIYPFKAIEIFEPYIAKYVLGVLYDKVDVQDVRLKTWNRDDDCDIIIFGDVIEHMLVAEATNVVACARRRCEWIIISVPLGDWPQGASEGNEHETHLSTWGHDDVMRYWPNAERIDEHDPKHPDQTSLGCYVIPGTKVLGEDG